MIFINEFFPNPVGNDNAGEFLELYNSGDQKVSLDGYQLTDGAKKKFSLTGYTIGGNGYLVLKRGQTGLALKNADAALLLYGPDGKIVDQARFSGPAPEGKSFSRVDQSIGPVEHFAFLYPTPGGPNETVDTSVSSINYPLGIPLSPQLSIPGFFALTIATASFFVLFFIYVTHNNRNISDFFFGRDAEIGP